MKYGKNMGTQHIQGMSPNRPSITRGTTPPARPRVEMPKNMGTNSPVHKANLGGTRKTGAKRCGHCK